ncbi:MAG: hypothetical protein RIS25_27 [Actinomycetota bacterium]|jgi:FtsH-binding integral membrane protein
MRKFAVNSVATVLWLQTVALWLAAGYLIVLSFTEKSVSLASTLFLDTLVLLFAVLLSIVSRGFQRGNPYTRGAILVWEVMVLGVAIASNQGADARLDIALILGIPAVYVAVMMLFSPSIGAKLSR